MIDYTHTYIYTILIVISNIYTLHIYILCIFKYHVIAHLYMIIRIVVAHSYLKLPDDIRG